MDNVRDKTAIVTGGASGIGLSISEELLRNGAKRVAIIDIATRKGQKVELKLQQNFGKERVVFFSCDVTKVELMKETFKKVLDNFGELNILVNNAGILNDMNIELMFAVNTISVIRNSFLALDYMGRHTGNKGGIIINIASYAGLIPIPSTLVYCASKHAVVAFSRCLQAYYKTTNVSILTLCPHTTQTGMSITNLFHLTDWDMLKKDFGEDLAQTSTHVACAAIDLIQKGKNGQIWCVKQDEPAFLIDIPNFVPAEQ